MWKRIGQGKKKIPAGVPVRGTGNLEILGKAYPKEIKVAQEYRDLGYNVILRGKTAAGSDLIINGVKWELKTLKSSSINAVRQNIRHGLKQPGVNRIIIDGRKAGISHADAIRAILQHQRAGRMKHAKEIIIKTKSGEFHWKPGKYK